MSQQEVQFVDERERALFARAHLSQQVRDFLESPAGRYLHGRAKLDIEQCQVDALECSVDSWWGRRKFNKIRQKAEIARCFLSWCVDAIQDGEVAYRELRDYRAED